MFTMVRVEEEEQLWSEAWGLGGASSNFTWVIPTYFEKVPLDHLNFLLFFFSELDLLTTTSSPVFLSSQVMLWRIGGYLNPQWN